MIISQTNEGWKIQRDSFQRWLLHKVYQWTAMIRAHYLIFFCRSYQCQCRVVGLEKVAFCVLLHILYARQPHKISFFKRHLCQATSILMYARKRADLTQKTCRTWQTYAIAKFLHAQQSFQNSLRFPPAFHISFSAPWYNCLVPILSLFYFFVLNWSPLLF